MPRTNDHLTRLEHKLYDLRSRYQAIMTWCADNVTHAEWFDRIREANVLSTNIEVLEGRITNIMNGDPEMGTAPATASPIHTATVRSTPK